MLFLGPYTTYIQTDFFNPLIGSGDFKTDISIKNSPKILLSPLQTTYKV